MRILFISDVPLAGPVSGSEQVLYHQATQLVKTGLSACAVTRQEGAGKPVYRFVEGVEEGCYSISTRHFFQSVRSIFQLPPKIYNRFHRSGPFDAAVSHQPFTCFSLLARKKLINIPFVYTFHSPSHEEYGLMHGRRHPMVTFPQRQLRKIIEGFCVRRAKQIMVLSRFMAERVETVHRIDRSRIVVNPGGVDILRFSPHADREGIKPVMGFPKGRIHLLTVRNLEPRMGLDNLLKALSRLREVEPKVHLTLVGEGVERANLVRLIKTLSLEDDVRMAGFAPSDALPDYYRAADFFILPTRELEGFGLVTPEAMACGTPVLGTPVGGTKEILSRFDKACLFTDASAQAMAEGIREAVQKRFADRKSYAALRRRCRKHAEDHYSWARHTNLLRQWLELITGIR